MVLMVESICGQDFAYAHEVEEERLKKSSQTRTKGTYQRDSMAARADQKSGLRPRPHMSFYRRPHDCLDRIDGRVSMCRARRTHGVPTATYLVMLARLVCLRCMSNRTCAQHKFL
jgi:hypothetical protein